MSTNCWPTCRRKRSFTRKGARAEFTEAFGSRYYTYRLDPWMFAEDAGREKLQTQFGTASLKGFGIDRMPEAIVAAGAILYYLEFTEHRDTKHISSIARIDEDRFVWIDKFSIRNLELFYGQRRRRRAVRCSMCSTGLRIADGRADVASLDIATAEGSAADQPPAGHRVVVYRRRRAARNACRSRRRGRRSGTDHLADRRTGG